MMEDEISRRAWLLRVGGTAALTQFNSVNAVAAAPSQLPPGLYEPSLQHLAHSMSAAAAMPILEGSPSYFSGEDYKLLVTLVSLILDEAATAPIVTEISSWIDWIAGRAEAVRRAALSLSAAHRRLASDYYGEATVRELETEDVQGMVRDGLASLTQARFVTLDRTAQIDHLSKLEDQGSPFLNWLKRRTLDGFYTSRQGLAELDYKGNAFYSQSPGCDHEGGHHGSGSASG